VDNGDRLLSLSDRILLTDWLLHAWAETKPKTLSDQMLPARLVMPRPLGITLRGNRAQVIEIAHQYR